MVNEIYIIMAGYTVLFVIGVLISQLLTGGLLFKILSVRMSRGKGVLLKVHSPTVPYFRKGILNGNTIRFKARGSKIHSIILVPISGVSRSFGVPFLEINEETNAVLLPNWNVVSGHDAQTVDSLMKRIAMLPKRPGGKELIMMILLIVAAVGIIYCGYKISQLEGAVSALAASLAVAQGTVGVIV